MVFIVSYTKRHYVAKSYLGKMSWIQFMVDITVISTINYIRKNGLVHPQFQQFLEEIEAEYVDVIYFTEVR